MNTEKLIQVLERVEHELTTQEGLYAFDGAAPSESFQILHTDLLAEVRDAIAILKASYTDTPLS